MNLGRTAEWDRRNAAFLIEPPIQVDPLVGVRSVAWQHFGGASNQADYRGCVGWTGLDLRNSRPWKVAGRQYTDKDGLDYYNGATLFDQWSDNDRPKGYTGHDPDLGSSGQGLAGYFKSVDVIDRYEWAANIEAFLHGLQRGPLSVGMEWTQDMFNPVAGRVRPTGAVAGGHQIMANKLQWNVTNWLLSRVWFANHWTAAWGIRGNFYMAVEDLIEQYKRGMDACLMTPKGKVL